MKTLLSIILLSSRCLSFAQHIAFEQTQDLLVASNINSDASINSYKAKDGTMVQIGDIIRIGKPTEELGLLTIDGKQSKNKDLYTQIYKGRFIPGYMMGIPIQDSYTSEGDLCTIEEMKVRHTTSQQKSTLYVVLFLRSKNERDKKRTVFDYERAKELGEIANPKAQPTKDEAIAALKEAKELLDLGVMSPKGYDSVRIFLSPIARKFIGQLDSPSKKAAIEEIRNAKYLMDSGIIDRRKYDSVRQLLQPQILR